MKKTGILLLVTMITTLTGCRDIDNPDRITTGTIEINIGNASSRDINSDDSTIASINSTTYEVLIYNSSTVLSTILDSSTGTVTLSAEPDTYTALVLAGSCTSSEGILLGSGYQESILIQADTITNVNITLTSISHTYSVPESVICSDGYSISVNGNTNNPLLRVSTGGTNMDNQPYIEIGESATNIYLTCSGSGSSWSGVVDLTAPSLSEMTEIKFYGSNIRIIDPAHSLDINLEDFGSINWQWLNDKNIPAAMNGEVNKNIIFAAAGSGVHINIDWS